MQLLWSWLQLVFSLALKGFSTSFNLEATLLSESPELCFFLQANYKLLFGELLIKNPKSCKLHSIVQYVLQIIFGFTFNAKLSFSKQTRKGKLFCCQINQSRVLFSFLSCDWLYFFQSWRIILKLEHRSQQPATQNALLICNIFATKRWLFVLCFQKKFPCISQLKI